MKTITVSGKDIARGLVTAVNSTVLPYGAAEFVQNVDWVRRADRIAKRKGIQVEQASNGAGSVTGYHQYVKSSGTKINLVAAGNNIYSVAGGVWTIRHAGAINGKNVNFVTFQNLCYAVCETESLLVWDGVAASFSVALGTPPANGKYIQVWQNRLWIANTSAGKSRLHYSADGNGQDWVTLGAAGFIDVDNDDGDEATGIMAIGPTSLYYFKNRRVYKVTGNSPSTFAPNPIILNRGCVAPRSLIGFGGFIVYMSQYGIHTVAPDTDAFLSEDVYYDVADLTVAQKLSACAGKTQDVYVLCYDSNLDGKNDKALVIDLRGGAWTSYTNVKANVFYTQDDGALLSGGSDLQIVRRHDTGEDDEGVAIDMIWRSGLWGFDDFTAMKRCSDIFWSAKPLTGKTLSTKIRVDGVLFETVGTSLTPHQTNATDETIKVIGYDGPTLYGRFIQVEFQNAELNAPVEIIEVSMAADLDQRTQTPT